MAPSGTEPMDLAAERAAVHGDQRMDELAQEPVVASASASGAGSASAAAEEPMKQQQAMDLGHSYAQPAHDQDEYDPANPSFSHKEEHSTPQDHTHTTAVGHGESQSPSTKRRHHEQQHQADDSKRHRSNESPASPKSSLPQAQRKGLSEAAFDRLLDFQSSGDFELAQVSRAAFASVGSLPEFAQVAVIARFTRTPMKDIRDKNGQLMRLYHDYLSENPHISSLQPVSAFIADYTSDRGLFAYGYAPPQPVTGVSPSPVPFRNETQAPAPVVTPTATASAHAATGPSTTSSPPKQTRTTQPHVDEFGRALTSKPSTTTETRDRPAPRASDPRLARKQQAESPSSKARVAVKSETQQLQQQQQQQQVEAPATTKPMDPRRREAAPVAPESASRGAGAGESTERSAPVDPRRRQAPAPAATAPVQTPAPRGPMEKSDLYNRLPRNVQNVLDAMETEGRLQEPINDNVISRLLHLPEHVALRAVENFSNVDLSHIENLQGFLVGIINRVNEKAIKAGDGDAPFPSSADPGAYPQQLQQHQLDSMPVYERPYDPTKDDGCRNPAAEQGHAPMSHHPTIGSLPPSVQEHLLAMAANGTLSSVDEFGEKCYEVLSGLSEGLANEVLKRFTHANLGAVRNRSGFLIGVVKRCRQEYGFL